MKTNLFDPPIAHRDDYKTSYDAGDRMIKSGNLNKQESMVLSQIKIYLRRCHKTVFTARDVSTFSLSWDNYFVIQRRLSGLHRKGKIERTGKKRDGCAVWRLV